MSQERFQTFFAPIADIIKFSTDEDKTYIHIKERPKMPVCWWSEVKLPEPKPEPDIDLKVVYPLTPIVEHKPALIKHNDKGYFVGYIYDGVLYLNEQIMEVPLTGPGLKGNDVMQGLGIIPQRRVFYPKALGRDGIYTNETETCRYYRIIAGGLAQKVYGYDKATNEPVITLTLKDGEFLHQTGPNGEVKDYSEGYLRVDRQFNPAGEIIKKIMYDRGQICGEISIRVSPKMGFTLHVDKNYYVGVYVYRNEGRIYKGYLRRGANFVVDKDKVCNMKENFSDLGENPLFTYKNTMGVNEVWHDGLIRQYTTNESGEYHGLNKFYAYKAGSFDPLQNVHDIGVSFYMGSYWDNYNDFIGITGVRTEEKDQERTCMTRYYWNGLEVTPTQYLQRDVELQVYLPVVLAHLVFEYLDWSLYHT